MFQPYFRRIISAYFKYTSNTLRVKRSSHAVLHSAILMSFAAAFTCRKYFMINQETSEQEPKIPIPSNFEEKIQAAQNSEAQMKKILQADVCAISELKEGGTIAVTVKNVDGSDYPILLIRYKRKVYAVSGSCTFKDELDPEESGRSSLLEAICFNDKLMCPHHGCAFDLKSGTVEYGPARSNLPIFSAQEHNGRIQLFYPEKLPKAVTPRAQPRDYSDLRKVVILGEDHNATIGCIDGLKQFGYTGEISVIMENMFDLPYDKSSLHKRLLNLRKECSAVNGNIEKHIQKQLEKHIYEKLYFYPEEWYKEYGVDFSFSSEPFRIIHKRFYPYITFFDGTKKEYDGLVISKDPTPVAQMLPGLTCDQNNISKLHENVFVPFRNKRQHQKMLKFLNTYDVRTMIVHGLNQYSLEFLQAMRKTFPDTTVTVLDTQTENQLFQHYGEELTYRILKEYTAKGVQFYLKVNELLRTFNRLEIAPLSLTDVSPISGKRKYDSRNIHDSVNVEFGKGKNTVRLQADCFVYFPEEYKGDTEQLKKRAKFAEIDLTQEGRIKTQMNMRTDTNRIFSIGSSSATAHFYSKSYFHTFNPIVNYEQGMTCAFNMLALNIPFAYIPVEVSQHFGCRMLQAGTNNYFNRMMIMGSVQDWDFLAIYAKDDKIYSVVASESRQREFQVFREAFRLQCQPEFSRLNSQDWTVPKIEKLIRKLNKSFCYRDEIHKSEDDPIQKYVIWIDREKGVGYANDKPQTESESNVEVDERGYLREV